MSAPELVKIGAQWCSPPGAPISYRVFHFKLPGFSGSWLMEIDGAPFTDPGRRHYVVPLNGGDAVAVESTARFATKAAALAALEVELARQNAPPEPA
jgi:hypothetical protein